jgi:trehalose-6-phosphate synthase
MIMPDIFFQAVLEFCLFIRFQSINSFSLISNINLKKFSGVDFEGRLVHVGTFPIGIEPEKFTKGLQIDRIQARIARLQQRFSGVKVLIGVDRLDYIKGVPQKVHNEYYSIVSKTLFFYPSFLHLSSSFPSIPNG